MREILKRIKISLLFIISLMILNTTIQIANATLLDDDGGEIGEEFGRGLGKITVFLLVIGFIYVIFNRGYVLIRKYVDKDSNPKLIETTQFLYSKLRKPLFYVHVSINILAIFFGIYHGLSVELGNIFQANLGWFAILLMILTSVSGFLMWFKIKPFWNNKDIRSLVRVSHRQWVLSILLIIVLLFHVSFGEID